MLAKKVKVSVASKPGHTKGKQWIRISRTLLVSDLPGILPKEYASKEWAKILFLSEIEEAAFVLLQKIEKAEGSNFEELYGIEPKPNEETLEKIALKFKFLAKGAQPDLHRAAKKILDDWNNCKLTAWWL
jgi:ribosome biogenesis GTPase A